MAEELLASFRSKTIVIDVFLGKKPAAGIDHYEACEVLVTRKYYSYLVLTMGCPLFGNEQRELSKDDFANYLCLTDSGARVYSLAYPNGSKDEVHLPPVESIHHVQTWIVFLARAYRSARMWLPLTTKMIHNLLWFLMSSDSAS